MMNSAVILAVVWAVLVLSLSPAGHAGEQADASVDGLMRFDRDGALSEDEALAGMFSLLDANKDGRARRSELIALLARGETPVQLGQPTTRLSSPSAVDPCHVP